MTRTENLHVWDDIRDLLAITVLTFFQLSHDEDIASHTSIESLLVVVTRLIYLTACTAEGTNWVFECDVDRMAEYERQSKMWLS